MPDTGEMVLYNSHSPVLMADNKKLDFVKTLSIFCSFTLLLNQITTTDLDHLHLFQYINSTFLFQFLLFKTQHTIFFFFSKLSLQEAAL